MLPRSLQRRLAAQDGFSIVEVLVAAVVLVVGLLGTLTLVDTATTTTFQTKAREQATSLQREIIESVRAIPYDEVTPTAVAAAVGRRQELRDTGTSAGWSIQRRGEVYTVSVGACTVDDQRDGTGDREPGAFCDPATLSKPAAGCQRELDATASATAVAKAGSVSASSATAAACGIDANLDGTIENLAAAGGTSCAGATCDATPADYKRVVSLVRWEQGTERRSVLMVTTIQNPGLSAAPAIVTLDPDAGTVISSASTTSASFTATASPRPQTVLWYLDGAERTPASFVTPDKWLWTWDFGPVTLTGDRPAAGELVDGTYTVAAKAFDRYGQSGSGRSVTITVDRRRPFAPRNFVAGRNGEVVDLAWTANPERDLRGYEVYRLDEAGQPTSPPVCPLTSRTSCQDTAPPATKLSDPTDDLRYVVFAVDGGVGKGDRSSVATAVDVNRPPNPPASLAATRFEGKVKLVWSRPEPEDPDDDPCSAPTADDPTPRRICYFTIYRDGELLANRYDRTATGEDLTWTDPGADAASHTYYVASVDRHLAESVKVGAVSP